MPNPTPLPSLTDAEKTELKHELFFTARVVSGQVVGAIWYSVENRRFWVGAETRALLLDLDKDPAMQERLRRIIDYLVEECITVEGGHIFLEVSRTRRQPTRGLLNRCNPLDITRTEGGAYFGAYDPKKAPLSRSTPAPLDTSDPLPPSATTSTASLSSPTSSAASPSTSSAAFASTSSTVSASTASAASPSTSSTASPSTSSAAFASTSSTVSPSTASAAPNANSDSSASALPLSSDEISGYCGTSAATVPVRLCFANRDPDVCINATIRESFLNQYLNLTGAAEREDLKTVVGVASRVLCHFTIVIRGASYVVHYSLGSQGDVILDFPIIDVQNAYYALAYVPADFMLDGRVDDVKYAMLCRLPEILFSTLIAPVECKILSAVAAALGYQLVEVEHQLNMIPPVCSAPVHDHLEYFSHWILQTLFGSGEYCLSRSDRFDADPGLPVQIPATSSRSLYS